MQEGALIRTDRVKADRPCFSGKQRVPGTNVQVIASPDGAILWASGALPGKAHDLPATRIWDTQRELERAGIVTLVGKGYQGAEDSVITLCKGKRNPGSRKRANRSHARLHGPGERANGRTPSSRAGAFYASSAAALERPGTRAGHRRSSEPPDRSRMKKAHLFGAVRNCSELFGTAGPLESHTRTPLNGR
ncbi:transposase family protein [Streptosporangium canum]|uniref:transposase family protein n=1 Tax=Streptosporangium canum TaxID=324952 RepID=UPI00341BD8CD